VLGVVAFLAGQEALAGVAFIALGVALIGGEVAVIGPAAIASSVRQLIDSATKAPQAQEDGNSSEQDTE